MDLGKDEKEFDWKHIKVEKPSGDVRYVNFSLGTVNAYKFVSWHVI